MAGKSEYLGQHDNSNKFLKEVSFVGNSIQKVQRMRTTSTQSNRSYHIIYMYSVFLTNYPIILYYIFAVVKCWGNRCCSFSIGCTFDMAFSYKRYLVSRIIVEMRELISLTRTNAVGDSERVRLRLLVLHWFSPQKKRKRENRSIV